MYWIIVILVITVALFMVWASADIGSNVYLRALCSGKGDKKVVSITFDDGPDETMTPKVLAVLDKYNVKATFFLVGEKVARSPQTARQIVEGGHIVANHTYSHKGFFPLSPAGDVKREIMECSREIFDATGLYPQLFRPPFGVTNPIIGRKVRELGLVTIGWSVRSLDTMKMERRGICRRVVDKVHPGAIILLHDRCEDADLLLEDVICSLLDKGYSIVPLDGMLNIDAYEN